MWNVSTILLQFCSDWLNSLLKNFIMKEKFDRWDRFLVRSTAALASFCSAKVWRSSAAEEKIYFTCAKRNQQQFSKIIFLCSSEICLKIEKLMLIWKLMLVSTNNSWCPRRKNNWHKKKWQWLEKSCVKLLEKRVLKVGWKKNILFLYK